MFINDVNNLLFGGLICIVITIGIAYAANLLRIIMSYDYNLEKQGEKEKSEEENEEKP